MRDWVREIQSRSVPMTEESRAWIWANYFQLDDTDRSAVLRALAEDPVESDVQGLDEILSKDRDWLCRIHATEALGILGTTESIKILEKQYQLESNHLVRFFIGRELSDNHSLLISAFLEQRLPAKRARLKRELWTYGKFKRGAISIEKLEKLLGEIPWWLKDELRPDP